MKVKLLVDGSATSIPCPPVIDCAATTELVFISPIVLTSILAPFGGAVENVNVLVDKLSVLLFGLHQLLNFVNQM